MDVNKAEALTPLGQRERRPKDKKHDDDEHDGEDDAEEPRAGAAVAMDGLLAEGVSPEFQQALNDLSAQIEPMRAELEAARGLEARLREQAEKHPFLPIPNRREFLRELAHVLSHMEHLSTPPALIVLHIANADAIRASVGKAALDAVLDHACVRLTAALHPTDTLGSLGGNDFGVVLLDGEPGNVADKAESLRAALTDQPLTWQGVTHSLEVKSGFSVLQGGLSPERALEAADRNLLTG